MKRMLFLLSIIAVLLVGCGTGSAPANTSNGEGNDSVETAPEEDTASAEEAVEETAEADSEENTDKDSDEAAEGTDEDSEETTEDQASEESADSEETNQAAEGFNKYRPAGNVTKTFIQDEFEIVHEVVDQNENFVQETVKFGDIISQHVYEWTEENISVVYSQENPETEGSIINEFETVESPKEVMTLSATGEGTSSEWEVVRSSEELTVPYGEYEEVLVLRKTITSETSGQQTITSRYFAPGLGMIKEIIEVDGDNGYTVVTELTDVSE